MRFRSAFAVWCFAAALVAGLFLATTPARAQSGAVFAAFKESIDGNWQTQFNQTETALSLAEQLLGENHVLTAACLSRLAYLSKISFLGGFQIDDSVITDLEMRARRVMENVAPDEPETIESLRKLVEIKDYFSIDAANIFAIELANMGFEHAKRLHGDISLRTGAWHKLLSTLHHEIGEGEERDFHDEKLREILERLKPNSPELAEVLTQIAEIRGYADASESAQLLRRVLAIQTAIFGPEYWLVKWTREELRFSEETIKKAEANRARVAGKKKPKPKQKGIYGEDDRKDWYEVSDPEIRRLMRATVALVRVQANYSKLYPFLKGERLAENVELEGEKFGKKPWLCKSTGKYVSICAENKYIDQPTIAECSGTLIAEDRVLTAGHCVREILEKGAAGGDTPPLKDLLFIFGYQAVDAVTTRTTVTPAEIYRAKDAKAVTGEHVKGRFNPDWAIVTLDRRVPPTVATPVPSLMTSKIADDAEVFALGFPSGLPVKLAPSARVRKNDNANGFVADLDAFERNSGSGVYDAKSKALAGILVSGGTDYVCESAQSNCYQIKVCPKDACQAQDWGCNPNPNPKPKPGLVCNPCCRGEDVLRLNAVKGLFP